MKISDINFKKGAGLVPVIIQHVYTMQVLMLGYMDKAAYKKTKKEKQVTFFSRSKKRLWTKGESSGNFLIVKDIQLDCDQDTLLIKAEPMGPTCHNGTTSCFQEETPKKTPKKTSKRTSKKTTIETHKGFIYQLQQTIHQRIDDKDAKSYTNKLYQKGINKVAQKVGEEAVELVIEAIDNNLDLFKDEAADLLYHLLILLKAMGVQLEEVEGILKERSEQ